MLVPVEDDPIPTDTQPVAVSVGELLDVANSGDCVAIEGVEHLRLHRYRQRLKLLVSGWSEDNSLHEGLDIAGISQSGKATYRKPEIDRATT
jgi:hypothetical protein